MRARRRRAVISLLYVALISMVLATVYITTPESQDNSSSDKWKFPAEMGGMILVEAYSGERAKSEIINMHIGSVDFVEGHIGRYEGDSNRDATFWVSVFFNDSAAINATERMTNEIGEGDTPFTPPQEIALGNNSVEEVYYVEGMGQKHYYWQRGKVVVWVAMSNLDEEGGLLVLNSATLSLN